MNDKLLDKASAPCSYCNGEGGHESKDGNTADACPECAGTGVEAQPKPNNKPLTERVATAPRRIERDPKHTPGPWMDLLEAAKAKLADCLECQDAALMEGEYCSNECGALAIAVAKAEGRQ